MNEESFKIASTLIDKKYVEQSQQAMFKRQKLYQTLLSQRSLPENGWDDVSINVFLDQMSQMDYNNQLGTVGVGEREGRIFSSLVSQRHFYLAHGIGRSGDLTEDQPKASGSSLIYTLCNLLVCHALKLAGAQLTKKAIVVPMCTGMSLSLVIRALALKIKQEDAQAKRSTNRKYIIWSRIDQKTCLKCIQTAGYEPVVIELVHPTDDVNKDALVTNLEKMESQINHIGPENILCVLSTTSCFAPRIPDKVVAIAKLCKKYNIGHVVNNAYGVQCRKTMSQISAAMSQGTLDAYVQSTDKNFMVPVGGSVVASNNVSFIDEIAGTYAGRASMSPILDVFITLLSMGVNGWNHLLQERMVSILFIALSIQH
jgi:O-phospho-L-seryl-tRNASec:L-selenocysteinyl-tRNA synthase